MLSKACNLLYEINKIKYRLIVDIQHQAQCAAQSENVEELRMILSEAYSLKNEFNNKQMTLNKLLCDYKSHARTEFSEVNKFNKCMNSKKVDKTFEQIEVSNLKKRHNLDKLLCEVDKLSAYIENIDMTKEKLITQIEEILDLIDLDVQRKLKDEQIIKVIELIDKNTYQAQIENHCKEISDSKLLKNTKMLRNPDYCSEFSIVPNEFLHNIESTNLKKALVQSSIQHQFEEDIRRVQREQEDLEKASNESLILYQFEEKKRNKEKNLSDLEIAIERSRIENIQCNGNYWINFSLEFLEALENEKLDELKTMINSAIDYEIPNYLKEPIELVRESLTLWWGVRPLKLRALAIEYMKDNMNTMRDKSTQSYLYKSNLSSHLWN